MPPADEFFPVQQGQATSTSAIVHFSEEEHCETERVNLIVPDYSWVTFLSAGSQSAPIS